jgi:RimJ/RimL family protein N-acetyltransferase
VTEPVQLRVPTDEDAALWCELFADSDVMRYVGNGEVRDHAYYVDLIERQQLLAESMGVCLFSVVVAGRVVGFTGVQPWSHPWGPVGSPEIGWRLGREVWGRGYATQAARAAVEHARSAGVGHLVAMIHEANTASFGVARKLGMETEEVLLSPEGTRVHQLGAPLPS